MERQTMQQKLEYWQGLLPTGSVWFAPQLTCRYVTIKGISYDRVTGYLIVQYTREDAPDAVFKENVGAFYNYIVEYQVQ